MVTLSRALVVLCVAPLLLLACTTSAPQKPVQQVSLAESRVTDAEPIPVAPGTVTAIGAVGGDTGARDVWYRFRADRPGEAKLTLRIVDPDELLSISLYNAAEIARLGKSAKPFERLLTRSADKSIETPIPPGEYYVRVAAGTRGQLAEFDLDVTYRPVPPAIAEHVEPEDMPERPQRVTPPSPPPNRRERTPAPTPPRPTPTPVPQKPIVPPLPPPQPTPSPVPVPAPPPPPRLSEPSRATASPLTGKHSVVVPIGAGSGVRWVWFEVTMPSKGTITLNLASDGAPAEVMVFPEKRAVVRVNVAGTASHHAEYARGKVYVRVGPSAGDVRSRITIRAEINFAGHIINER